MQFLKKCHNVVARVIGNTILIGIASGAGFIVLIEACELVDKIKMKRQH